MCETPSNGDLNPDPSPSYLTNTNTCGVTTVPRMCSGTIEKKKCQPNHNVTDCIYNLIGFFKRKNNKDSM